MVSRVPQRPQKRRRPKLLDAKSSTSSAPPVMTKGPAGGDETAVAGEPETGWEVRQWHQRVSNGALAKLYLDAARAHPPSSSFGMRANPASEPNVALTP